MWFRFLILLPLLRILIFSARFILLFSHRPTCRGTVAPLALLPSMFFCSSKLYKLVKRLALPVQFGRQSSTLLELDQCRMHKALQSHGTHRVPLHRTTIPANSWEGDFAETVRDKESTYLIVISATSWNKDSNLLYLIIIETTNLMTVSLLNATIVDT